MEENTTLVVPTPETEEWLSHRDAMLRFLEEQDCELDLAAESLLTAQQVREMMRACGVRPEQNLFSRDIIQAKYPDESE
jgi:hypothetical protein